MGASDNVVRGGLTVKAVDVDDLLAVVDPTLLDEPVIPPSDELVVTGTPIRPVTLHGPDGHEAAGHELVVTSDGRTGYVAPGAGLDVPASVTPTSPPLPDPSRQATLGPEQDQMPAPPDRRPYDGSVVGTRLRVVRSLP